MVFLLHTAKNTPQCLKDLLWSIVGGVLFSSAFGSISGSSSPTIVGCTINGRGIDFSFSHPVITGCTLTGSGIYIYTDDVDTPATITDCTITGNSDSEGIIIKGNGPATITGCTITGGTWGINALDPPDSPITIPHCTITGCTITDNRNGIRAPYATITDCTVTNNTGGNGIIIGGASTIINCTVTNNAGKGIVCWNDGPFTITDCTVTDNGHSETGIEGGGIWVYYGPATITRCIVSRNAHGDAIRRDIPSEELLTITDCIITDNDGVGIVGRCPVAIIGCSITGNTGDGITDSDSESLTITDCTVSNNGGGGVTTSYYSAISSITISSCVVTDNGGKGIDLYFENSATITDSTITQNAGTGIFCYGFSTGSSTIKNCVIRDNVNADSDGYQYHPAGGITVRSCVASSLTNCLIVDNHSAASCGGVWIPSGSYTITNCTISGNEANSYGGLLAENSSDVTVKNTIVHGNTPDASEFSGSTSISYSDIAGYSGTGAGNIDENPLFVGNGDYRLSAGSPCIDTGTAAGAPDTDIMGTPRPQGAGFDMGTYEYIVPRTTCPQCTGDPIVLQGISFNAGTYCECIAATSITIGRT